MPHGYAPYEEAAAHGRARMSTLQRIGQLFAGAGQGIFAARGAANPLEAGLLGFSGSYGAANAARQAAEQYAMKQIEAERAADERQQRMAFMEAQIERMKRPEKPEKPEKLEPWQRTPEEQAAILDFESRMARIKPKPDKEETGLVQIEGPDGAPIWVRPSTALGKRAVPREKPVTGVERTALAFYNRAKSADDSITSPSINGVSLEDQMAALPLPQQAQLRYAPNVLQSPSQQVYRQAQRAFTEARLRKESGAAIPLQEYENDARTYFAQPGDSQRTIKAKRAARQVVLKGLKFSAGKAYDEYYGGAADTGGAADLIYNPETGELEPAR